MKKVIVIASAVLAMLFAIGLIIFKILFMLVRESHGIYSPPAIANIVEIGIALLIILFSSSVIFNIKLPKSLRIPLAIISILMLVGNIVISGLFLCLFFIQANNAAILMDFYIAICISICLVSAPVTITLGTYIRRTLWPAESQRSPAPSGEDEIEDAKKSK